MPAPLPPHEDCSSPRGIKQPVSPLSFLKLLYLFLIATCCKILVIPSYRSTDFDVHRHWKAVARHLPMREWYYDDRHVLTRHTLDYPPGFIIYIESILVKNPLTQWLLKRRFLDDACVQLLNDDELPNAVSERCIIFMRSTVMISDIALWLGAVAMAGAVFKNNSRVTSLTTFLLTALNPGLLWLDHVHFQYNGLLLGMLLASLSCLMHANLQMEGPNYPTLKSDCLNLLAASLFAILLTMKHLFMPLSLWYLSYLLRRFCVVCDRFSFERLALISLVTAYWLVIPFVPLLATSPHPADLLSQICIRLFPFGRGLVHDYWAGNIWAVYMATDKAFNFVFKSSLPDIAPSMVAVLLFLCLFFGARCAWISAACGNNQLLLLSFTYSALTSFITGYHVHEKAIMMTLLPLTFLTALDSQYALLLLEISAWGILGLFPLLFESREILLKATSYAAYLAALYWAVDPSSIFCQAWLSLNLLFISGVMVILEVIPMSFWGRWEFLRLIITSLSCSVGLLQCFVRLSRKMIASDPQKDLVTGTEATLVDQVHGDKVVDVDDDFSPPVRVVNENGPRKYSYLLSEDIMQQVAQQVLPRGIAYCPWKRLYRLSHDGDSFAAFMNAVKGEDRTLLVIQSSKGALFGAFADSRWENATRFVGGSSACLYSVMENKLVTYKWSGSNRYIQLCDATNQRIAFGGGSDSIYQSAAFGLSIQQQFQIGTTEGCATFRNEPLCSETRFAIEDIEVFGFLIGQF